MDNITTINLGACPLQYLSIGYVGETGAREQVFDFSAWAAEYGSGVLQLLLQRPGDAEPYPVLLDIVGTTATWTPDDTDTEKTGQGQAQLVYTVGGVIAKNAIFRVLIAPSLGAAGDPPEPYETWLERLTDLAAATLVNAQNAANSEEQAGEYAGKAKAAAEKAEEAVTHYPVIINGYWCVWDVTSGEYVSTGIEAQGPDGFSPTVVITAITNGHRVTITDANGPHVFDVLDGAKGDEGDPFTYDDFTPEQLDDLVQGPILDAQNDAIAAVEAKGREVIESIPDFQKEIGKKAPAIIESVGPAAVATFDDAAEGMPLKSLIVNILFTQEGTGNPAPDNIRNITAYTSATANVAGKNLWSADTPYKTGVGTYSLVSGDQITPGTDPAVSVTKNENDIIVTTTAGWKFATFIVGKLQAGSYNLSFDLEETQWTGTQEGLDIAVVDKDYKITRKVRHNAVFGTSYSDSITISDGESGIAISAGGRSSTYGTFTLKDVQLEFGSVPTAYVPYVGANCPVSWEAEAGTIAEAAWDVLSGEMPYTRGLAVFDGSEDEAWVLRDDLPHVFQLRVPAMAQVGTATWRLYAANQLYNASRPSNAAAMADHGLYVNGSHDFFVRFDEFSTVAELRAYLTLHPLQVVYPIQGRPLTAQLDPADVEPLPGVNNLWSDAGTVTVEYPVDTKSYVDAVREDVDTLSGDVDALQDDIDALEAAQPRTVTVTGTVATITAEDNTRYVCGEVSTLDITLPASGCIDVIFESGSTPTVLTVTPPTGVTVHWANGFDPDALETETTYEINIADGLGVAASWGA